MMCKLVSVWNAEWLNDNFQQLLWMLLEGMGVKIFFFRINSLFFVRGRLSAQLLRLRLKLSVSYKATLEEESHLVVESHVKDRACGCCRCPPIGTILDEL
jgi:hypothetical protein